MVARSSVWRSPTVALHRRAARSASSSAARMASDLPPVRAPDGFVPPDPKALSVPDGQLLSALSGSLALALRFGSGIFVQGWTPGFGAPAGKYSLYNFRDTSSSLPACARPAQALVLYEYEPSPYCRKVRPRTPHAPPAERPPWPGSGRLTRPSPPLLPRCARRWPSST